MGADDDSVVTPISVKNSPVTLLGNIVGGSLGCYAYRPSVPQRRARYRRS
jgi:hypothetical protein